MKQFTTLLCAFSAMFLTNFGCSSAQDAPANERPRTNFEFGVLQSTAERAPQMNAAGIELAQVGVPWRRFEPRPGQVDAAYVAEVKTRISALRAAGQKILLDVGIQYAPDWVFELPHSRYKNQYGEEFVDNSPGMSAPNGVWNQAIRDRIAQHYTRIFAELGTDFHQVRLGGGWYGELHFPKSKVGDRSNLYWGFDDIAQGRAAGLPAGMKPAPIPGWKPGTRSLLNRDAALFADWYMGSMQNYHDWQIQTVRKMYPGSLAMLYPSWGIRPGQLDAAIAVDLDGSTSAEKNGEIGAGLDFERFIAGITDPKVLVSTTWLDAPFGDDNTRDPVQWTPGHYLAYLAARNPLNLRGVAENTGKADIKALQRSIERMRLYNIDALIWAFEPQLFDPQYVSFDDFAQTIKKVRAGERSVRLPARPDALHARVRAELKSFTDWLQENKAQGFIGELGWPDDALKDSDEWNALADVWYRDANAAKLWVTYWATGEWWGTGYKLAAYEDRRQPGGVDTADLQAAIIEAHPSTPEYLRGINVAGAEFGDGGNFSNANPGIYDQAYHYDNASTFKFLAGRGIKLVLLPFRWERIQHTLSGPLDADELRRLKEAVGHARAANMEVILDVHNYARYKVSQNGKVETLVMGTPQLPTTHLSDLWRRLSTEFKNDAGVHYGLMNEPHDIADAGGKKGGQIWEEISQTVLDTIRANGDKKLILVPGYGWSGVRAWREHHPKGWIKDPANNFRYEAHHYWDATAGGQYNDPYSGAVEAAVRSGYKP